MSRAATRPTSTSTIIKIVVVACATTLLSCLPFAPPAAQEQSATLAKNVGQLGTLYDYDYRSTVEELAKTPRDSVGLLIEQLHPVKETRILASENKPDAEHVLWCIRALRYLTGGKDFCGKTKHKFVGSPLEERRKYWVYFRHHTCASFFAMWPSRGSEYIAPEDAQKEIIAKWKRWFATEGATFDYKPLQNPEPEQWLW